jgi:hypothetical protein
MFVIRTLISAFLLLLLWSTLAGWGWTATHQPAAQAVASHVVLGLAAVAGLWGLFIIWKPSGHRSHG